MFPLEPFCACTPTKPGCTPLCVCTRPRSCPFRPVRPENLALRPVLSRHMFVLARLCLFALKTWLYATGRVCMFPFKLIWACTHMKPGCTPLGVCVCSFWSPFVPIGPGNLAVRPYRSVHVPVQWRIQGGSRGAKKPSFLAKMNLAHGGVCSLLN